MPNNASVPDADRPAIHDAARLCQDRPRAYRSNALSEQRPQQHPRCRCARRCAVVAGRCLRPVPAHSNLSVHDLTASAGAAAIVSCRGRRALTCSERRAGDGQRAQGPELRQSLVRNEPMARLYPLPTMCPAMRMRFLAVLDSVVASAAGGSVRAVRNDGEPEDGTSTRTSASRRCGMGATRTSGRDHRVRGVRHSVHAPRVAEWGGVGGGYWIATPRSRRNCSSRTRSDGSTGAARAGGSGRCASRLSPVAIGHPSARSVCLNPKSSNASAWPVDRRRLARCRAPSRSERVPRRTARTACSRSRAVAVVAEGHVAEGFAREWDLESEFGRLTRSAMELLAWLTISSMCASCGA